MAAGDYKLKVSNRIKFLGRLNEEVDFCSIFLAETLLALISALVSNSMAL